MLPTSVKTAPHNFQNIGKRYSRLASNFTSPVWLGITNVVSAFELPGPKGTGLPATHTVRAAAVELFLERNCG